MVPPVEGDFTTELGESWEGANEPTGTDGKEPLNVSSINSGLKAIRWGIAGSVISPMAGPAALY